MAATKPDLDIVSRVPSKVWEQIFQHVSVLQLLEFRLICRNWKSIVDGCPALMKRIRLRFPEGFVLDREYKPKYLVPARNLSLEKVRISAVDSWWSAFGKRIVDLSVNDCEISLRTLLEMLKSMKCLKALQLNKLRMLKNPKAEANFKLSKLEKFTMDTNAGDVLDVLVSVFTRLRWISLPRQLNEKIFINLVHTLKDTLEGITVDYTEAKLKEILQLKQLTHLIIRTGDINNQALTEIGNALPKLKCLAVGIANESTFLTFLNTMKVIENISIEGFYDNQKIDFGESKNPKLTCFELRYFYPAGTNLHKYLYYSNNITKLVFCFCKFDSWFVFFATLELYCLTLQRLELELVVVASAEDNLSEYFDSLKYLKIQSCEIPKKLLIKFISLCPQLEEIHLESMSSTLDDEVILMLSQKLEYLEKFTLIGSRYITDESADHIEENFHSLRQLTVRNCLKLSDVAKNRLKNLKNVRCLVK